jgi:hypothetical protein
MPNFIKIDLAVLELLHTNTQTGVRMEPNKKETRGTRKPTNKDWQTEKF